MEAPELKLRRLEAKRLRLAARIQRLKGIANAEERRRDTRRKILAGAFHPRRYHQYLKSQPVSDHRRPVWRQNLPTDKYKWTNFGQTRPLFSLKFAFQYSENDFAKKQRWIYLPENKKIGLLTGRSWS